jgi:hypothetical protein
MSARMKLLPKGRKRISIFETGHRLEVVESGSAVEKKVRRGVQHSTGCLIVSDSVLYKLRSAGVEMLSTNCRPSNRIRVKKSVCIDTQ